MNDGGPAFPCIQKVHIDRQTREVQRLGMSLRDVFAKEAMGSMFAGAGARMVADRDGRYNENNWAEIVAMNAYEMADAMIAEREKNK